MELTIGSGICLWVIMMILGSFSISTFVLNCFGRDKERAMKHLQKHRKSFYLTMVSTGISSLLIILLCFL